MLTSGNYALKDLGNGRVSEETYTTRQNAKEDRTDTQIVVRSKNHPLGPSKVNGARHRNVQVGDHKERVQ